MISTTHEAAARDRAAALPAGPDPLTDRVRATWTTGDFGRIAKGYERGAAEFITRLTGGVIGVGVQLAAPAMVALLLTDLFFGLVNRVAPQINVFFLSLPVKMGVGLAVVLVSLPLFKERYVFYFKEAYKAFEFMIRALGGSF